MNESGTERILVCNGLEDTSTSDRCYEYSFAADVWTQTSFHTIEKRNGPKSIMLDNSRLFVTGGSAANGEPIYTTEVFNETTQTFEAGPQMPDPLRGHCAVQVDDKTSFVIGGLKQHNLPNPNAYKYNWLTKRWAMATDMLSVPRSGVACSTAKNGSMIVVAGGHLNSGEPTDVVEYFTVDSGLFIEGPSLPYPINDGVLLTMDNDKLLFVGGKSPLLGGDSDKVFELDVETDTWTERVDLRLSIGRSNLIGSLIPDSVVASKCSPQ